MTRVYLTHRLTDATMARLGELFALMPIGAPLTRAAKGCDVLVPTLNDSIDAGVIDALLPELKLIANFGAGVDHIDVAYAKSKGVMVSNTPSVLTEDTADVAMALILAVPRRLSEAAQAVRTQQWKGWDPLYLLGHRVHGKTLGIVGMGRIGRAVAKRAAGFGLAIHYHQRTQLHPDVEKEFNATYWPTLDGLLKHADIVSLHCPHTLENHRMIGAAQLQEMKRSAYLINTARGALIDEKALVYALREGTIAAAGLDVYEHAPNIPADLRALPNVLLLPHVSSATVESRDEMGQRVLINIKTFVDGHRPPDRVLV
jgi:glyoxylate reductase